jgi:hypothetical protein
LIEAEEATEAAVVSLFASTEGGNAVVVVGAGAGTGTGTAAKGAAGGAVGGGCGTIEIVEDDVGAAGAEVAIG